MEYRNPEGIKHCAFASLRSLREIILTQLNHGVFQSGKIFTIIFLKYTLLLGS